MLFRCGAVVAVLAVAGCSSSADPTPTNTVASATSTVDLSATATAIEAECPGPQVVRLDGASIVISPGRVGLPPNGQAGPDWPDGYANERAACVTAAQSATQTLGFTTTDWDTPPSPPSSTASPETASGSSSPSPTLTTKTHPAKSPSSGLSKV